MLNDLDELILSCDDPRSRQYIEEAVLCYKAGAYRSSVVACWIAVAFDLVDKIRELAAAGDKEAQVEITRFETIQKTHNLPGALTFEKELPLMAKDKFEFISHIEYMDIVRLVEDRNRCAHPSQVSDNQVFSASAELARLHIFNAVSSILSKPASQGKVALARVLNDLDSKFFPNNLEDVVTLFEAGPLKRSRESLYNNLLKVLIKAAFGTDEAAAKFNKCVLAMSAIKIIQPNLWEKFFPDTVKQIIERMRTEEEMCGAVVSVVRLEKLNLWSVLPKAEQLRILTFIKNAPAKLFADLDWFYLIEPLPAELLSAAEKRIMLATFEELDKADWYASPPAVINRFITIYSTSKNFADANLYGRTLRRAMQDIKPTYKQANELIRAASHNDQIKYSNEISSVVRQLESMEGGREAVAQLMLDHGLDIAIK
ncbi:hypothetical protein ASD91_04550 [Pseudomonas sp. Root68]|uniref:hypothetical protein n=1 Tax=unclassified Pseudomonas TaxID=196821 RepID=UPI000701BED1|nr:MULTISPECIES: hypothetical protein [unclassified Pseudomonas]KRB05985.1 hypothetical protein ASD91_04550 [Pseudomonas sp. Root68]KRB68726.1 hypothetical protein ASD95_05795 [Pseudomonas sp. Root71]